MKHHFLLAAAALLTSTQAYAQAPPETLLLREPALSRDRLAFSYAGDIWIAGRDGSNPQRLTVGPGVETSPHFSPDGQFMAFTGDYDRNADVYVVAVSGGQPRRLTWHPSAETVRDWTPDGQRILFSSSQEAYARGLQLFTVAVAGGLPTRLPLLMGEKGSYSADGQTLAHTHITNATDYLEALPRRPHRPHLAHQPANAGHRGNSARECHRHQPAAGWAARCISSATGPAPTTCLCMTRPPKKWSS